MPHRIAMLYGSVRKGRLGTRVIKWLTPLLDAAGYDVDLVDAAEHSLPLLETPMHHMKPGEVPEPVQKVSDLLTAADGFVVVAGEYNHAIQPGLSNMIDYFYRGQFGFKPALIASYSYGPFAGVRAAVALRTHLAEVGMVTIPTTIAVPSLVDSLNADGEPQNPKMVEFASAAIEELGFFVRALAAERAKGLPGA